MHVSLFVQRFPPALGGSEAYFARLADYHRSCGDSVTVWTTTAIELEAFWRRGRQELPPSGFPVRRFSPIRFPGRKVAFKALSMIPIPACQAAFMPCNPVSARMWREAGRDQGPIDAVHATAFPYAFPILCGLRLARRRKVPFLLTPFLHLGDPDQSDDPTRKQYTSGPLRWLLHQADRVFVQTQAEQRAVRDLGVSADRIVLQGLGVDADCTGGQRNTARIEWKVASDDFVVGHLANLSEEKGTVDLLIAAERLWNRGADFRLVLAGPEMTNFRRFWQHYEFKENVTRLSVLTEDQKRDFFAGIDVLALPSRSDSFGLVLLEAWMNGKPNLVYRAGGPGELIRHEIDGLQVPCGRTDLLAEELHRLITDRSLGERLGRTGQDRVQRDMAWPDKLAVVRKAMMDLVPRVDSFRIAAGIPVTPPSAASAQ